MIVPIDHLQSFLDFPFWMKSSSTTFALKWRKILIPSCQITTLSYKDSTVGLIIIYSISSTNPSSYCREPVPTITLWAILAM